MWTVPKGVSQAAASTPPAASPGCGLQALSPHQAIVDLVPLSGRKAWGLQGQLGKRALVACLQVDRGRTWPGQQGVGSPAPESGGHQSLLTGSMNPGLWACNEVPFLVT